MFAEAALRFCACATTRICALCIWRIWRRRPLRKGGKVDPALATARAKIDACETLEDAIGWLDAREMRALLGDKPVCWGGRWRWVEFHGG